MSDTVVVIGGGPAGVEGARNLAHLRVRAVLGEGRARLRGTPIFESYAGLTPYFEDAETAMDSMIADLRERELADVRTSSRVTALAGDVGAFEVTIEGAGGSEDVHAGAIVVCTGFTHFDPG